MKYLILGWLTLSLSAEARWLTKSEAGSVIEKLALSIHVNVDGSYAQETDYAVRVQAEDAKTSASVFTIEYNSQTDKVEVLEAYTLNGASKIAVDTAAIEDRDKGESKDYDAMKVRTVVFPQVQIGSRLFVRYRTTTAKALMKDRWSDDVTLHPGVIVEKFSVQVDSALPIFFKLRDPGGLLRVSQKDAHHLSAQNRKEFPGWVVAEKDPFFHPHGWTELWMSSSTKWDEFMTDLNQDFNKIQAAGVPAKLHAWIKAASKLKTPDAKILSLMEKMSQNFRYFGDWRRHNGGLVPRTLAEIESSRYGDCKDLSSILSAMLRALDIPANVVLIRRGDNPWGVEPDYELPVTNRFNHAIVQVVLGSRTLWLDATNPVASLEAYADISGRPAYILNPKGAYFDRVAPAALTSYEHVRDYEYSFRGDNETDVRLKAKFVDLAAFHLANELMMAPRSEVLSSTLEYFSEGQDITSYKYLREPETGRTLKDINVDLRYEAGRVLFNAGGAGFFVIPDGFLTGAFYETANRESDLKLSEEIFNFTGTRRLKNVRLAQTPPALCKITSEWVDLERTVSTEGEDVLITQKMMLKKPYIEKSEYTSKAYKALQNETKRCFYRSGVLIAPAKVKST